MLDKFHQGVPADQLAQYYHNSMFVDDNGIADTRDRILGAVNNSARSAYDIFGHPNDDHRAPCLSEEKQLELASFLMQYLGFSILTRLLVVLDKRQQLADLWVLGCLITPKQSSSLLGLVCNGATIAPMMLYLSLHLQHLLNDETSAAWGEDDGVSQLGMG
jgi:hypothetical protein